MELNIHDFQPRISGLDQSKEFVAKLIPALNNLQLEPQRVLEGMAPLQYVIAASRKSRSSLLVEGFSAVQPRSIAEVRLTQPLRAMASCPAVQCSVHLNEMRLGPAADHLQRILIRDRFFC